MSSTRLIASRVGTLAAPALRPVALIAFVVAATTTVADPDLWGHVRFGLDILNSGHVVTSVDPYSFTQDRPFLYHEWLGGTIMAAAYRLGGVAGLMALKALLVIAIVGLVWDTLRRVEYAWRWAGLAVATWGTLPMVLTLRPQLWTAMLVVIVCRILTSQSARALLILPPLFALWANLHGGWIVGGELVAVWTTAAWLHRDSRRWALLAVGVASLLATLVNPYGWNLWIFLAQTIRFGRDHVTEWQPVWQMGALPIGAWIAAAALVALSIARRRPSPAVLGALAVLALSSLRVSRLEPLFALSAVMLLSPAWPGVDAADDQQAGARMAIDVLVVAAVAAVLLVRVLPRCIRANYTYGPDAAAAESLRPARGRLVTSFNWGEYVIWHFGPALKVSIDGRRETLYDDRTVTEQMAIWKGTPDGIRALARLAPDYAWLPSDAHAAERWLLQHGYREDVRTADSFIAVRDDLPPLQTWQGTPSGCFPGP